MGIARFLHVLGAVIWVGGMFFAYMALRPAAASLLEPAQRLPLWQETFRRFFFWVWLMGPIGALLSMGDHHPFWELGIFFLCVWIVYGIVVFGEDERAAAVR